MQFKLTPIIPRPLNVSGIQQALIAGMRDVGQRIREDFEDTTRTWEHQPAWEPALPIPKVGLDSITVATETDDKVYGWVSRGTRVGKGPYEIPKVPGVKRLAYPSQFIPKTFPGITGSGVGFSGGPTRFATQVLHPGVEPRDFEGHIGDKNLGGFKLTMERAMKFAAQSSGHGR